MNYAVIISLIGAAGVNRTDDDDLVLVTKGYLKQYVAEIIESLKS